MNIFFKSSQLALGMHTNRFQRSAQRQVQKKSTLSVRIPSRRGPEQHIKKLFLSDQSDIAHHSEALNSSSSPKNPYRQISLSMSSLQKLRETQNFKNSQVPSSIYPNGKKQSLGQKISPDPKNGSHNQAKSQKPSDRKINSRAGGFGPKSNRNQQRMKRSFSQAKITQKSKKVNKKFPAHNGIKNLEGSPRNSNSRVSSKKWNPEKSSTSNSSQSVCCQDPIFEDDPNFSENYKKKKESSQNQSQSSEQLPQIFEGNEDSYPDVKIKKLIKLAEKKLDGSKYQEAKQYWKRAQELIKQFRIQNPGLKADILKMHGTIIFHEGSYDLALVTLQNSLKWEDEISDVDSIRRTELLILIGSAQIQLNLFEIAKDNFNRVLDILSRTQRFQSKEVAKISNEALSVQVIKNIFYKFDTTSDKNQNFEPLNEGSTERKRRQLYIQAVNKLGILYCYWGNSEKAISYFMRVFFLTLQNKNLKNIEKNQVYNDVMSAVKMMIEKKFDIKVVLEYAKKYSHFLKFQKRTQTSEYVSMQIRLGGELLIQGHTTYSMRLFKKALNTILDKNLKNAFLEHLALKGIGEIEMDLNNFKLASMYMIVAIDVLLSEGVKNMEQIVQSYNILAKIYQKMGEGHYLKAEQCYDDCLKELEEFDLKEMCHLKADVLLQKMGICQVRKSEDDKQRWQEYFQQIKKLKECTSEKSEKSAYLLRYISQAYQLADDFSSAISLMLKSKDIFEELKKDNPNKWQIMVIYSLKQLGYFHLKQKEYQVSMQYFKDVLEGSLSLYGEKSLIVASSRRDIALVYQKLGYFKQAIEEYKKELEIRKVLFDEQETKQIKKKIEVACKKMGQLENALHLNEEVLQLSEKMNQLEIIRNMSLGWDEYKMKGVDQELRNR